MTSALVYVLGNKCNRIKCRALLDTGATTNFISDSVVRRLGVRTVAQSTPVRAINGMNSLSKEIAQIKIRSIQDDFTKTLTCLTLPAIANLIPSEVFPRDSIKIPSNIKLADPEFHLPRPIDLLIGAGASLSMFSVGQINLSSKEHDLYLQKTRLGWVVASTPVMQNLAKSVSCALTNLESQLTKFWTIEEVTVSRPQSEEETDCETHFMENVTRNAEGRYVVGLPFRNSKIRLGDSKSIALKRLASLERRLSKDEPLRLEYTRVIEEYKTLGHMSLVTEPDDRGFYMPHHAVVKQGSNTTKVRVVFDASARTASGVSLNDVLMSGPTIQDGLFAHLIRFRTYRYVITADIEKMYRQVLVHERDRQFQRILWRENDEIQTYQLNTLTFGVSSSPFLAIRTIHKLADDEAHAFPRAANVIKSHLYVDDLLTGAESFNEARSIRDEIIAILSRGGFSIRQWASNNPGIICDLPNNALHAIYTLGDHHSLKTLGVSWNTDDDKIQYFTRPVEVGSVSKRRILSEIAKIYDPIGLMGPVILHAKILMQDLWRSGVHWDESVPQDIHTRWMTFARQLDVVQQISYDRNVLTDKCRNIQLHGFCDASNAGYGACLYVRSIGKHNEVVCKLLCSKSRVSPLKPTTIPRLELCGALLLARLFREASSALKFVPHEICFWCDSTIVLHWLNTRPHSLKTYVANRVTEILELTELRSWHHVRSEDNPADAVSRGQLPHIFAKNQLWSSGPSWLVKEKSCWPNDDILHTTIHEIPELRKTICLATTLCDTTLFGKYSSYTKLCRIVAYCLRFRVSNIYHGPLCINELEDAEIRVLKLLQVSQFLDEIKRLQNSQTPYKGKFVSLNPFIGEDGLIRVGGRLRLSNLTFPQKHPILLPSRNRVTDQIIREIHERHHHTGIQSTLYALRQKFWILDGRNQIRKIVRTCTRCLRFDSRSHEYKMGSLPTSRVTQSIPFSHTGIDFCGPFYVKEKKYRNRNRIKVYICVFICLSIKAMHFEVVSDLTTEGFLAALRRFVARRGLPGHIYSDNGTNFVGANNQLKEMYALLNSDEHKRLIYKYATDHHITWSFIPPASPHFGGLWESTVRLFKHHCKRVIGDSLFTFEELNTFVIEIEGILNSRPITSLSSDPNDSLVLTPAHYLTGRPLTALPESNVLPVPANRLSAWQHITKVRQDFWARWHLEYLNELQKRAKWANDGPKLEVGTIVLIKERNVPCMKWPLGRITRLYPGEDGVSRVADLQTVNGTVKRTTRNLCLLPLEQ